jgi:hypothetical protein
MALVTFTRYETARPSLSLADLRGIRERVGARFGALAVREIQRDVWAEGRFKRTTGKSTRAWTHELVEDATWLVIKNPATNKYGTNYPKFVHLSGRPRRDFLMLEVRRYAAESLARRVSRALADEAIATQQRVTPVTRKEVIGG